MSEQDSKSVEITSWLPFHDQVTVRALSACSFKVRLWVHIGVWGYKRELEAQTTFNSFRMYIEVGCSVIWRQLAEPYRSEQSIANQLDPSLVTRHNDIVRRSASKRDTLCPSTTITPRYYRAQTETRPVTMTLGDLETRDFFSTNRYCFSFLLVF